MNFLIFITLHLFMVLSPGPTLIGIATFAINNGFKKTIPFLLGISFGNLIFVSISVFGLSEFIFKFKPLEIGFYFFSGIYLIYFGFKIFIKKKLGEGVKIDPTKSFLMGFGIEISNPKSIMFTTTLIALIINVGSGIYIKLFSILWLVAVGFLYEILLTFAFVKLKEKILNKMSVLNKIFGVLLVLFGFRMISLGFSGL